MCPTYPISSRIIHGVRMCGAGGQAGPELGGPVPPTCANETGMLPSSAAAASVPVVSAARPRGRRAGRQGMTPTTVTGVTKTVIAYPN